MRVYWGLLLLSFVVWYMAAKSKQTVYGLNTYKQKIREDHKPLLVMFFSVMTILCGLRSGVADTGAYIHNFNTLPFGLSNVDWAAVDDRKGFYFLMSLYKTYISDDYHGWLFWIALVSCVAVAIAFHKYASDVGFTCFLFMATTLFTYLINGIRQFICVSILFACTCWIEDKNFVKYVILVLLLSTIHSSVFIMIPVYFLARLKTWSDHTIFIIGGAIVLAFGFDSLFPVVDFVLSGTDYNQYSELLHSGTGSNVFRLVIAAVPVVLSFLCREQIERTEDGIIRIASNMSIMNFALYIVATFTNGMSIGRLTIYFDMYNLLLLPWLINNYPAFKDRNILKLCAIGGYIGFFYFQMVLTWNLPYVSDILNLFVYH